MTRRVAVISWRVIALFTILGLTVSMALTASEAFKTCHPAYEAGGPSAGGVCFLDEHLRCVSASETIRPCTGVSGSVVNAWCEDPNPQPCVGYNDTMTLYYYERSCIGNETDCDCVEAVA